MYVMVAVAAIDRISGKLRFAIIGRRAVAQGAPNFSSPLSGFAPLAGEIRTLSGAHHRRILKPNRKGWWPTKRNISPIGLTLHPRVRMLLSEWARSRHSKFIAEAVTFQFDLGCPVMVWKKRDER